MEKLTNGSYAKDIVIIELERVKARVDLVEQKSDMAVEAVARDVTRMEQKIDHLVEKMEGIGSKAFWLLVSALGCVGMEVLHLVLHVK